MWKQEGLKARSNRARGSAWAHLRTPLRQRLSTRSSTASRRPRTAEASAIVPTTRRPSPVPRRQSLELAARFGVIRSQQERALERLARVVGSSVDRVDLAEVAVAARVARVDAEGALDQLLSLGQAPLD